MWAGMEIVGRYSPRDSDAPTRDEFAARVAACDPCEKRRGNWCEAAGGCGLIAKLARYNFGCPLGLFGVIARN